jgi:hypothetical protein
MLLLQTARTHYSALELRFSSAARQRHCRLIVAVAACEPRNMQSVHLQEVAPQRHQQCRQSAVHCRRAIVQPALCPTFGWRRSWLLLARSWTMWLRLLLLPLLRERSSCRLPMTSAGLLSLSSLLSLLSLSLVLVETSSLLSSLKQSSSLLVALNTYAIHMCSLPVSSNNPAKIVNKPTRSGVLGLTKQFVSFAVCS